MAQVDMRVNGRSYEISCDDGQEEHVARLGRYVDKKVGELAVEIGQVGDTRLLVMAALLIADELTEAYGAIEEMRNGQPGSVPSLDAGTVEVLAALARRVESVAASLDRA